MAVSVYIPTRSAMDMEFEQALGDGEGRGSLTFCSPWCHKESDTTEKLNNKFWLMWGDLTVVFICLCLIMSHVEHLFMCLFAICMSSLEKCLFRSFAYFLIELFLVLSCMRSLHILWINPLSNCFICCYFFPILRVVFSPCLWFSLIGFHLLIFRFISIILGGGF